MRAELVNTPQPYIGAQATLIKRSPTFVRKPTKQCFLTQLGTEFDLIQFRN